MSDLDHLDPAIGDIRALVAEVLGVNAVDIADDANLVHMGLQSLQLMQLVNGWRREGLTVDFRELAACPTIEHWRKTIYAANSSSN
jgi:aryl carrier-like protein